MTQDYQSVSENGPEKENDISPLNIGRRNFLAMGTGVVTAFVLPSFMGEGEAIADSTYPVQPSAQLALGTVNSSQEGSYNGLDFINGFPQPYSGPLGTLEKPTGLDILPYMGKVNGQDAVISRSYNLVGTSEFHPPNVDALKPGVQYFKMGPTFRFKASEPTQNTLNLKFTNKLPKEGAESIVPPVPPSANTGNKGAPGRPMGFNSANLHFHGLHVSPNSVNKDGAVICGAESRQAAKSSDDMLFYIPPGEDPKHPPSHRYEVVLPQFHAPGTHWYHAHNDGSTALHVVDGTAGALLLEDEDDAQIDVDQDLLWVIQELEGTELITTVTIPEGDGSTTKKSQIPTDQLIFNCASAPKNLGYTVNGVFQPSLTMKVNELQRWRFLNGSASPRGFMRVSLYKVPQDSDPKQVNTVIQSLFTTDMNLIAIDGISFYGDAPDNVPWWDMSPANRADFLVQLSTPGTYWVVKEAVNIRGNAFSPANGGPQKTQVLATVTVGPDNVAEEKTIPAIIPGQFPTYLQAITDSDLLKNPSGEPYVRPVVFAIADEGTVSVADGVSTGIGCGTYEASIKEAMPTPRSFTINQTAYRPTSNEVGQQYTPPKTTTPPPKSGFNFKTFQSGDYSAPKKQMETVQIVKLNTCEEWIVYNYSNLVHPFHIHVNPFFLVESHDPNGQLNQQGLHRWWDVIAIPAAKRVRETKQVDGKTVNTVRVVEPGYVRIRNRFWDYWGEYVFHCHILVHEDMGMMQNVYVANDLNHPGNGPFQQVTTSPDPSLSQNKTIGDSGLPNDCYPTSWPEFQPFDEDGNLQYPEQKDPRKCLGGQTCETSA